MKVNGYEVGLNTDLREADLRGANLPMRDSPSGPRRGPYPELSGQSYDFRNLLMNRWSALNSAGSASSGASLVQSCIGAGGGSFSNGTGPSSALMCPTVAEDEVLDAAKLPEGGLTARP